ncbi:MAG: hypothetical protein IJ033_05475 [Clostridia bacterium]|nr:hypothetical protein [Clostridia bacterium]
MALYVLEHYPGVAVGLTTESGELAYALEKQGNKTYYFDGAAVDERARFIIAIGGSEDVDNAKRQGLPYVVLSKDVPLSAIQGIGVVDFQIMEFNPPKAIFIDNLNNDFHLQAELTALSLGVLAEAVGIVGTGLRNERVKEAYLAVEKLTQALKEFKTHRELLEVIADVLARIKGAPFFAMLDKFITLRCTSNFTHARFYSIFSLLYLVRVFTKKKFCAILPYMDFVRVRTLCEEMGVSPSTPSLEAKEITYKLSLVEKLLPTTAELKEYLDRFWLEAGREKVDFGLILTSILLSASKAPKTNMLVDLAEAGFIDALLDSR